MIVRVPRDLDIVLSMSWEPHRPHGICGHIYEMIEYGMLLSEHMKTGLLFGDTIQSKQQLIDIISNKYTYTDEQINRLVENTIISDNPTYVIGTTILIVDGGLRRFQEAGIRLIFDNIICFKCSYIDTIHDRCYTNVTLLQDDRLYANITPEDCDMSTQYVKKIDFQRLRDVNDCDTDTCMLYLTGNCRELELDMVRDITGRDSRKYLIVTNDVNRYNILNTSNVTVKSTPVNNIFEHFNTYVYTPTLKRWDGSPRFPAECMYFNRRVEFCGVDDQYMSEDRGLYYRMQDIQEGVDKITLSKDDDILSILNEII